MNDLIQKVRDNAPLTDEERQMLIRALGFSDVAAEGSRMIFGTGLSGELAAWRGDESWEDGSTPLFSMFLLDQPDPELYRAMREAYEAGQDV